MNNNQPNDYIKPTLETRIIKLENGDDFVLEYPSNYNEIVDKKLARLDQEYEETIKATLQSDSNSQKKEENAKVEGIDVTQQKGSEFQEIAKESGEKVMEEANDQQEEEKEDKLNDKEAYQKLDDYNQLNEEDDEFVEVKENGNVDDVQIKEENLEKCKEQLVKEISKEKTNNNNVIEEINSKRGDNIDNFEFAEERNQPKVKRQCSPVKNPEKIREAMRSIHIPAPKWANNISDEEFLKRAKFFLSRTKF